MTVLSLRRLPCYAPIRAAIGSLVLLAIALGPAAGEEWWQFRGPEGQGHSVQTKLPVEWSPEKNVAWRVPLDGEGWSSPVVRDGRIYLTAAVPEPTTAGSDYSLRAVCLDAENGAQVWETETFRERQQTSARIHAKNSHASPTPLVADYKLFVHFGHEGTACLDLSGKILWKNDTLRYSPVHGNGGSPVVVDDLLVFSCDGGSDPFIVALDQNTGDVRWKTGRDQEAAKMFSFSTPLVIEVQGKKQIVSPASNLVAAYDPATGKEIWRVTYDGYSVIPRPVFAHGLLFISTGYDSPQVMAIRPPEGTGDFTDSHVAWTLARGAPHTPSMLVVGDELYMISDRGIATCVDAKSGSIHWQERLDGNFSASPLFADGKIYAQSEDGVGYVLAPGTTFQLLAKNDLKERSLASYAIIDQSLLIRTAQHLYRIK
jgi:outer membrane protein assembly factor BamB